jgi:ceramide glucosyltransferase
VILEAVAAVAAAYQLVAIVACVRFRKGQGPAGGQGTGTEVQPASILKPVRGSEGLHEAVASHLKIEGEYELLCGIGAAQDDAAAAVLRAFPRVRIVESATRAPNQKAAVLIDLAREARFPVLVVNDADIVVEPDYLARVTAPLSDPSVGLVTCLYRPEGSTFAARFEGLGVSTDFAPSTLVARLVGVDEFAMGSTLALRRADLDRIGGFESVADYLADDYQLGHRIHGLGLKCVLSEAVVSTHLGGTWPAVWSHQLRWSRTIRVSKFGGYLGLPVTFATLWAVVAASAGNWEMAAALMTARMAMALTAGWMVLRSRDVLKLWFLIPARDLFAAVVWAVALFGRTVEWRGLHLRLDREGRIRS